jgi:flagellar FliL protein
MAQAPKTEEPAQNAEEVVAKKKSPLMLIIIAVLVLAIGGGAAYYFMADDSNSSKAEEEKKEKEKEKKPEVFLPLESFTVNLLPEGDGQQQYLQVSLSLQVPTEEDVEKLKQRMPEVRNRVLFVLSSKKPSEISSAEGKAQLIEEVIKQVNTPFYGSEKPQNVSSVYFTSFIIQ